MPSAIDQHAEPSPRQFRGVAVSSTFEDLKEHRDALIDILTGQGLLPLAMEHDSARPGPDVIESSLQKVREGAAYVGIISRRYGQVPPCPRRNPGDRSITELEFDEAQRLGRPILLFLMGEAHPVREADVELDPENRKKLQAFRERAKQMGPDAPVHRVYDTFNSLEQFRAKAARAVAELEDYLQAQAAAAAPAAPPAPSVPAAAEAAPGPAPIPAPPAFYAEPAYIGSHQFVGRQAELDRLSDWAAAADPHPVLLFEAIGGTGKSMLTWEWTTRHATAVRGDWAGRFWYSFYEKGAIMADFCRRALAYITGRPLDEFRKKKTRELGDLLLRHLQARPWLLVLDGLERVLVAYHRYDAAQLADEEAGSSDQIARRDPCDAIRPEDDELLRMLAGAAPSKLLLTSRLTPRVLLNQAGQPIPGVQRVPLPGLRPPDAELLLRSCGIAGSSQEIQNYLKSHCDCHPLVTGVLAGLINDYLPDRGNFDAWAADPDAGGQLNLANLDLVQKRNHILRAAIDALPEKSRELLSILALLPEAADYGTLSALNPHLPPEPEQVQEPQLPQRNLFWEDLSENEKARIRARYQVSHERWQEYTRAMELRAQSAEFRDAPRELAATVRDLERRGLLQYDQQVKRYDLHPVVRGIAAGGLRQDEKNRYGQRMVDHFSAQTHRPYEEAETLDDLLDSLQVVRALLQMGQREQAYGALSPDLLVPLHYNLEAHAEALSLLRACVPGGWGAVPPGLRTEMSSRLLHDAGIALEHIGALDESFVAFGTSLRADLQVNDWVGIEVNLFDFSRLLGNNGRLAKAEFCNLAALEISHLLADKASIFANLRGRFMLLSLFGRWDEAEETWRVLDPMGREWSRGQYRPGEAEIQYARHRFWRGDLREEHLYSAENKAKAGRNRWGIRLLHGLRGRWRLGRGEWALAAESLHEAVRMAREVGTVDSAAESRLAAARFHLGQLAEPVREAERIAARKGVAHQAVAELWLTIGEREQAKKHALLAYTEAWADGEPYVHRYDLNQARDLLARLGVEPPDLPPYDPAQDEKLPWEDEVVAAIAGLREEKQAERSMGDERE